MATYIERYDLKSGSGRVRLFRDDERSCFETVLYDADDNEVEVVGEAPFDEPMDEPVVQQRMREGAEQFAFEN